MGGPVARRIATDAKDVMLLVEFAGKQQRVDSHRFCGVAKGRADHMRRLSSCTMSSAQAELPFAFDSTFTLTVNGPNSSS